MFQERCKKSKFEHITELDLKQNPCCLEKLIILEKFFETKNLTKYFSDYFFKYIKIYYKKNLITLNNLNGKSELLFLNLLIKYSSFFYFTGK